MKSAVPKVLHKVAGLPLLGHVIAALKGAGVERVVVVTSAAGDAVRAYAKSAGADTAIQQEQLGTGHAAACAREALAGFDGTLLVVNGDMPLITADTIVECLKAQERTGLAMLAFEAADPASYGRVLMTPEGYLDRIVEFKDANADERATTFCNAGCYAADAGKFFGWAAALKNDNAQKEYYLTDVPALARQDGVQCAVAITDELSVTGVNSRAELAEAERKFQARMRARFLADGVTMTAPETVFFAHDTKIENDVEIEPFVMFAGGVTVRNGVRLRSYSHLEGATVASGAIIGPFARLRPGADIGENAHIGNFVEVKNSKIGAGAKANHLTYLGDASVGEGANIGAGTITCNYDGFTKAHTEIGAGAFIGSNTALVAPVTIGDGAVIGAGSVITEDVEPDSLAVERTEQKGISGWARRFRERMTRKAAE